MKTHEISSRLRCRNPDDLHCTAHIQYMLRHLIKNKEEWLEKRTCVCVKNTVLGSEVNLSGVNFREKKATPFYHVDTSPRC